MRELTLFRMERFESVVSFGCTEIFPDAAHCAECHLLDQVPFKAADRRGTPHQVCCEAVALMKGFGLLREPDFWPDPVDNSHRERLRAWIQR